MARPLAGRTRFISFSHLARRRGGRPAGFAYKQKAPPREGVF